MFDREPLSILTQKNKRVICKEHRKVLRNYESCIEKQRDIILEYVTSIKFEDIVDKYPDLKGIVYKNTLNLYAALELIKIGYHSSAAILLRNIFEGFLIIIQIKKYNDNKLYRKYRRTRSLDVHKALQENPNVPENVKHEVKHLWEYLCKKNHATNATMQVFVDYNINVEEDYLSNKKLTNYILTIFGLFVDINWILTQQYIFFTNCNEIIKVKYLDNPKEYNKFIYKYKRINKQSKYNRSNYTEHSNILINYIEDYNGNTRITLADSFFKNLDN